METERKNTTNPRRDLLLHLYGEASSDSELRMLLKDPLLRDEYQTLSEAKFRMDHRPRRRPDTDVIDRIMASAGSGMAESRQRADRRAVHRTGLRRLFLPAISVAAVVIFGIGLGWFTRSSEADLDRTSVPFDEYAVQADRPNEFAPSTNRSLWTNASTTDSLLAWDAMERVRHINRRLDAFQKANSGLDWGAPTVPLESLPGGRMPGLQTAGSNW